MRKLRDIVGEIEKFLENEFIFFTTPGHKQGRAYEDFKNILKYDLTEVDGLDNLHNPTECIKNSLNSLSEFYKSVKSFYLVNGSTSGIHIMLFSCFNEYDEILVERGCHKSIIDGIFLRKLKINYINREKYNVDLLVPCENSKINYSEKNLILDDIKRALLKNKKIKGVVLTNPNYYGFYINQKEIYEYLKNKKIFLLIDGAHGAHIRGFNKDLLCPNEFCDMSVMSAHKTLPSLTQGAYLHVNNKNLESEAQKYFSIFTTTSPSYLIMSSLENSLYVCYKNLNSENEFLNMCKSFGDNLKDNKYLTKLNNFEISNYTNGNFYFDDSRICLKFKQNNINPKDFYKYLFSKKIICEMVFFSGVVLIPTIYTTKDEMRKLYFEINNFENFSKKNFDFKFILNACENLKFKKIFDPYELQGRKFKLVKLEDCIGEVCFEDIFLYPPGTPIIFRGEEILKESAEIISGYLKNCYNVSGVYKDGYIKILED